MKFEGILPRRPAVLDVSANVRPPERTNGQIIQQVAECFSKSFSNLLNVFQKVSAIG